MLNECDSEENEWVFKWRVLDGGISVMCGVRKWWKERCSYVWDEFGNNLL